MWRSVATLCLLAVAGAPAAGQALPPPNLKVAFIGDQGLGTRSVAVLHLIQDEGADIVVHSGDFDYSDDPAAWEAQINSVLGANFPYFASVGNHDENNFDGPGGYQEYMQDRMVRLGIPWAGDLGALSAFSFQGLFFVMTSPGIFQSMDPGHVNENYLRAQLAADDSAWRISSWHKDMRLMQVGDKSDETGWGVYEAARAGGAIIATAHEHSYSRTHLLSNCQNRTVTSTDTTLELQADDPSTPEDEGRSFVFVSGLGGESIRDQQLDGPWWASIYTSDQGANGGALFGTFNYQGDPCLAAFYFKDIDGVVADEFLVRSNCGPCASGSGPGPSDTPQARIVWRRPTSGANEIWLLDGTQVLAGSGPLPAKGSSWTLAGTGDFDGNGSSDLLWRRQATGESTIWLLDGGEHLSSGALPVQSPPWTVAGARDFDGDGQTDILWRNPSNGQNAIWFMDGTVKRPVSGVLPSKGTAWSLSATGDFDGNGYPDLLWRRQATGETTIWLTAAGAHLGSGALPILAAPWAVAGTGDFDGDGQADILWRRLAGSQNMVWFMDGTVRRPESGLLPDMSVGWLVAGAADLDADGSTDILWRKPVGGNNLAWFMQGTSLAPAVEALQSMDGAWIGAVAGD